MWDCGNVASKSCVVDPVDEDTEEGGGLFTCIWLELRLDLDDEGGCHGGEQTSLCAESARLRPTNTGKKTHEDQGGVHIFVVLLDELSIVFFRFMAVLLVEFGPDILLG